MQEFASVIVTLIDTSCLSNADTIDTIRNLCKQSSNIILLLTNSSGGVSAEKVKSQLRHCFLNYREKVKFVQTFNWNLNTLKPEVTFLTELLGAMKQVIQGKECSSLSEYGNVLLQEKKVILDEKTEINANGKALAKHVYSSLCSSDEEYQFLLNDTENIPIVTSKDEQLSLQGKSWKTWSELNKKQHKNKGGRSMNDLGEIQKEMDNIQQLQAQRCSRLSKSMRKFIEYLVYANENFDGYPNFLLWLKSILNENSRNVLPGLFIEFRQAWLKVREAKDKKDHEDKIKSLQEAAEQAEIKLATASFGLEHFLRELGLLYQYSELSTQPIIDNISLQRLPSVMADLIIKGQAFEIMDGDASNIAIKWLKEVLKRLQEKIGYKTKLFIVSVLGIQSSGKSTLLNALFGLQFTVSAGRCTRGVFGQLVPIDKRKKLPYDYILVVDTEGLRAPELGQIHLDHDNELATFVIGIGDVTLINIKGENTAEMKDILQITVQAFLRMKLANSKMELQRKCIFIHQNVGAVNAEEQMMQGLKQFQENLDIMTKNAAEEENMRHIQSFNQVIDFQGEKHVLYFPDLWFGDPPMAPCNPGYSMKVMEVAQRLDNMAMKDSALTTIDGLTHRIEDLWNGILAENFVFSFRNTLEIKTFNSMESKFQTLCGEYGSYLMEWFENEASIEIDLCKSQDSLQECNGKLINTLKRVFLKRKDAIKNQLIEYFDTNEMSYILIQWKNSRVVKFDIMTETVERNTSKYIEQKIEEQRIVLLSKSTDRKLEEAINSKAKELAKTYRGQEADNEELEFTFSKVWIEWTSEFIQTKPSDILPWDIENMLIGCLLDRLEKIQTLVLQELTDDNGTLRIKNINKPCLESSWTTLDIDINDISKSRTSWKIWFKSQSQSSINKLKLQAIEYTDNIFRALDVEFDNLLMKDVQIRTDHAADIINKTVELFEAENNIPDHKITFQTPYLVKLVVHVCSYAFSKFKFMADRYAKKHGVKGKLDAYKETAKHIFFNIVQKKSDEFVAADFFCDRVKERVMMAIQNAIPRQIVEDIIRHFSYEKYHVMLAVMEDLALNNDFSSFIRYIKDSKSFVHSWMNKFINKTIFESKGESDSRYLDLVRSRLLRIMRCISEAIVITTKQTISSKGNWAQLFESNVKAQLAVPSDLLDPVTRKITDVQNFKEVLSGKIDDLKEEILKEFQSYNPSDLVWKGASPNEKVMAEIWGCPQECPLCREPCQRNEGHLSDDVSHSCIQHRPLCVKGTIKMNDKSLEIEPCNFKVQSNGSFSCNVCRLKCRESGKCKTSGDDIVFHPYKEYKTYLPDWDIAPNPTMEVSKYWMWFVGKYIDKLVTEYNAVKPEVPESWKAISDKDALDSLRVAID